MPLAKFLTKNHHALYDFINPKKNLKDAANGKTVLVTGAGSGVGVGIATAFAQAGASNLILVARNSGPLEETASKIKTIAPECKVDIKAGVDISDLKAVDGLFSELSSAPDVLVANAAAALGFAPVAESDTTLWSDNIDINLKGAYYLSRAYLRKLDGRQATLINISSNSSFNQVAGGSAYSASKAGLNLLVDYLHTENRNLRVFAVQPGGIGGTKLSENIPDEIKKKLIDPPELPGSTTVYLSTDRADYLRGRFVDATWDMEELQTHKDKIVDENLLKMGITGIS